MLLERYRGCLLGLACGDAVGTTLEFSPRGCFEPLTDMIGGGPFQLAAGQWTDDTSMALCLAESLLSVKGFDALDQMNRYMRWWETGYLSATGECKDIGITTMNALSRFKSNGNPIAGDLNPRTAGNGSLMRLAPIVLFFYPNLEEIVTHCAQSSRTTHAAYEAVECCMLFGAQLAATLAGESKDTILHRTATGLEQLKVIALAEATYLNKDRDAIIGSGYAVESLEAALWCFAKTRSFKEAILAAANLGDDADTTAAITGQIAGAYYGVGGIPAKWLKKLHMSKAIGQMAENLYVVAAGRDRQKPN